ncbi:hypothetical protein [Maritimibacter sp. 55A14]|nr:hypothetical protein [Maritimibacter sp. 55A14]
MKAMLTAFAVIAIIAVAAPLVLERAGFSAQERSASTATRLD